jgi:ABC-type lipoprotein export system ATPase subunit
MIDAVLATRISKTFKTASADVLVLQDVSFRVQQGSSVALLGQARSGKTTLLHLLAGLEQPSSGSLIVFQQRLETLTQAERASYRREGVGLVSPEVPWMPQFSLQDNVALPLLLANVNRREAEKRVTDMCSLLELRPAPNANMLTALERQQWSLARGLIHHPKLLLVDGLEDLDNEAAMFIEQLLGITSGLATTVIFTTRQALVAAYAEQIFTLKQGRLETSKLSTSRDVGRDKPGNNKLASDT